MQSWSSLSSVASLAEDGSEEESGIKSLRPNVFLEYIGQERVKETVKIACSAALKRGDTLDHILFHGPPGLGKTSMARLIANELGVGFKTTSGPVIEKPGDLAAILTSLNKSDILFIDEIHRMPRVVEEVLYPAMEDFEIDIMIGNGPAAKSIKIDLKPFTLIGATTRTGLLTSPLRDRFGLVLRLDFYKIEELRDIVLRSAKILALKIEDLAALEIARRSRGTPRIANKLLKRVRDYAQTKNKDIIDKEIAKKALDFFQIDNMGLDEMDRYILKTIIEKFSGGPVGIETISSAIGEEKDTIEDVYEPFLIQEGFLVRTRRGRIVTELGYKHLGLEFHGQLSFV
ncbi:MAG: Holliday junction branch migration DNA helicase RuvB [Bdellovibrionota bacterium]